MTKLLRGSRILVADDEFIIAMAVQSCLEDEGAEVVGPSFTLAATQALAKQQTISAAVLDVRLGRESVEPAAQILSERGIPFLFYSGQSTTDTIRREWPHARLLTKPASDQQLVAAVVTLLQTKAAA